MQLHTPVDFAGSGTPVTLSSILGITGGKWFQVTGITIAGTPARVGDAGITTSRGIPIGAGGAQFAPPIAFATEMYDFSVIYVLVQSGDTVSVACAV